MPNSWYKVSLLHKKRHNRIWSSGHRSRKSKKVLYRATSPHSRLRSRKCRPRKISRKYRRDTKVQTEQHKSGMRRASSTRNMQILKQGSWREYNNKLWKRVHRTRV